MLRIFVDYGRVDMGAYAEDIHFYHPFTDASGLAPPLWLPKETSNGVLSPMGHCPGVPVIE